MTGDFGIEIVNILVSQAVKRDAFSFVGQALVGIFCLADGIRFIQIILACTSIGW